MRDSEVTRGRLLVIEYEALKQEQRGRISVRDNLIYATLASMAAVTAAALRSPRASAVLLLLPPVCLALGWTYLVNDQKVSAIGRYMRDQLKPQLQALLQGDEPVFGWEVLHRTDRQRRLRKIMQLVVDLAIFCMSGFTALVVFWCNELLSVPLLVVSVVELLAILGLTAQFFVYSELGRSDG